MRGARSERESLIVPCIGKSVMKALVYNGPWDMTLEELPKPEPKAGEALLRMEAVGICGSDVHGFTGESGRRAPGMVMGHEAVGRVVSLGDGVSAPAVGSRVAVYNILADVAPSAEEGDPSFVNKKVVGVNLGTRGAMAEYLAIPAANAIPIAEDVAPEIALLAEPVAVVLHGFGRLRQKNIDAESIAIIGAGTIGLSALLVAKEEGKASIAILDTIPEKLAQASGFGGKGIRVEENESAEQISSKVHAELGRKPDLVIDAVGSRQSFAQAIAMVNESGSVLLIGNLAREVVLPLQTAVSNEITIVGTYGFDKEAFEEAVRRVPRIKDELATFIQGRCQLAEAPQVMARLARGELNALKVVIEFGSGGQSE